MLSWRLESIVAIQSIFSLGRYAWNFLESILMPKNSIEVFGLDVLSWVRGILSSVKTFCMVKRCLAGMEFLGIAF